jgi:hypothetical protein
MGHSDGKDTSFAKGNIRRFTRKYNTLKLSDLMLESCIFIQFVTFERRISEKIMLLIANRFAMKKIENFPFGPFPHLFFVYCSCGRSIFFLMFFLLVFLQYSTIFRAGSGYLTQTWGKVFKNVWKAHFQMVQHILKYIIYLLLHWKCFFLIVICTLGKKYLGGFIRGGIIQEVTL